MADQLERRFDGVDRATMPDLWGAIEVRAQHPAPQPRGPRVAALVLAVLVAAAVIGGLVWALQGRESQPAVQPGVNGDIGYVGRQPDGHFHLFAIDPTSGVTLQLTGGSGYDFDPVWSPDGTEVVFVRDTPAAGGSSTTQLVLRARDGTERVLLECAPPRQSACGEPNSGNPSWSPDGSRLAWVGGASQSILQVMDLATGHVISLCRVRCGPGLSQITWSPNGQQVAFSNAGAVGAPLASAQDRTSRIWVQRADGSSPAVALSGSAGCSAGAPGCLNVGPSWSPDGDLIAFVTVNVAAHTAVAATMRPDGSDVRVVDSCPGHDGCSGIPGPVWSPDGTRFALTIRRSPSTGMPAIRIFTPANGDTNDLSLCAGCSPVEIAWSPDGTSLAFIKYDDATYETGLYVVAADGTGLRSVLGLGSVDVPGLSWLPAGAIATASTVTPSTVTPSTGTPSG
ncbi:MAG: TolB family protein [Planctomycetaceae bacterium]